MGRSKFMLSVLWLLSAATHAFSSNIQAGSVDGVAIHQCDTLTIGLALNSAVYDTPTNSERTPSVDSPTNNNPVIIATDVTGFSFDWVVSYPAGTVLFIGVGDDIGDFDATDTFTVLDSSA
ncbi:hypothetical protein C8R45DRAFT_1101579 [Mycena sanguinolenta]|nr:hypothetical protein C8R45DRAFT_1101579 [Mycena sanguinolenta]